MTEINRSGFPFPSILTGPSCQPASPTRIHIVPGTNYCFYSDAVNGLPLYNRTLHPIHDPALFINHSPKVSHLLLLREQLQYQQQKNQGLCDYLQGLLALRDDGPRLQAYCQGKQPDFKPRGYDLMYQRPGDESPVSFTEHPDPQHLQYLLDGQQGLPAMAGKPVIQQYQSLAEYYGQYLDQQLQLNQQQLTFNGYPEKDRCEALPMAYRVKDVVRHSQWLAQPEQGPVPLLAGFSAEAPRLWGGNLNYCLSPLYWHPG